MSLFSSRSDSRIGLQTSITFFSTAGTAIPIPSTDFLESFEITLPSDGAWTGHLELFDFGGAFLEALTLSTGLSTRIHIQFGYDGQPLADLPTFRCEVVKSTPKFSAEGVRMNFELVSKGTLANVLDKKSRSFDAGLTATDIFLQIAADRTWRLVDRQGVRTVEASHGFLDTYATSGESDIRFLRETILKQAVDASGAGFVFFFDADGAAHWHSINRSQSVTGAPYTLAASYTFARDAAGDVVSFEPSDNVIEALLKGAGNATYSGLDSLGGTSAEKPSTVKAGPEGVELVGKQGSVFRPETPETAHARIVLQTRDTAELDRLVASRFTRLSEQTYKAELEVRGNLSIVPQGYVSVRYVKRDGSDHYLGGTFKVLEVTHKLSSAGFTTSCHLVRMGTSSAEGLKKVDTKRNAVVQDNTGTDASFRSVPVLSGGATPRTQG